MKTKSWVNMFLPKFVIHYEQNNKVKKDVFQAYGGYLSKEIYKYWLNHHSEEKHFLFMSIYYPYKPTKKLIYTKEQLENKEFWKDPVTIV